MSAKTTVLLCVALLAPGLADSPDAGQAPARAPRVKLQPQLAAGQTLHYLLDYRHKAEGQSSGLVDDPQASRQRELAFSAELRLQILAAGSETRARATFQRVAVSLTTDTPDPAWSEQASDLEKLKDDWLEFFLDAQGNVRQVAGAEKLSPLSRDLIRVWLADVAARALALQHPAAGVVPGERWAGPESPVTTIPLRGLTAKTESTYLRDEPCGLASPRAPEADLLEPCAVVLTRTLLARDPRLTDSTPPELRQQGLRVAGRVDASSETLTSFSLRSGRIVGVTQSSREFSDIRVTSQSGELQTHSQSRVETTLQLILLPAPADP